MWAASAKSFPLTAKPPLLDHNDTIVHGTRQYFLFQDPEAHTVSTTVTANVSKHS